MNILSEQQIELIRRSVTAFKMIGGIRNPNAMIDSLVPKGSPIRALINGNDYDAITEAILRQAGYDTEKVKEQLAGII